MEERNLKDYIVKLNDRNIQRQRESGFTMYAIFVAIIYCLLYLIDNINIISEIYKNKESLNICVFTCNAILLITFYFITYISSTRFITLTKIFPYQKNIDIEIKDAILFIPLALISFLNFEYLKNSQNNFHTFFLYFFSIISILNIISPFIIYAYREYIRRKKKKRNQSIEILSFTYLDNKTAKKVTIGLFIYTSIMTLLLILALYNVKFNISNLEVGKIIKYTSIFFSLFYALKLCMDIYEKQNDNNLLEDFEKEIFFENITNDDIAKKFEKDFAGIPFTKWVNEKHTKIIDFFDTKRKEFLAEHARIIDLGGLDKSKLQYEYEGRLQNIIEIQNKILNETNDFVQMQNSTFSNLKNFASLNDEELNHLYYVQNFLNQKIMNFNQQYYDLSQRITSNQVKR